jgi:membrane protein
LIFLVTEKEPTLYDSLTVRYFQMNVKTVWHLIKNTVAEWQEDNALRLGAALSYYTAFSLAPLLLIVISVAGLALGNDVARSKILDEMRALIGTQGSGAIETMLENASKPAASIVSSIIGFISLILGATGVVGELHDAMNTVWEVEAKPAGGVLGYIRQRVFSFAMVIGIGFLLLVSLVISAGVAAVGHMWGGGTGILYQSINFLLSLAVTCALFALMFRFLPDVRIRWRNAWVGGILTAILFTIGKTLTGIYLGRSAIASTFGAAGSFAVVLVWVYYSSQIVFFGAEFTQVYAEYRGENILPDEKAQPIDRSKRAEQGMPPKERREERASREAANS